MALVPVTIQQVQQIQFDRVPSMRGCAPGTRRRLRAVYPNTGRWGKFGPTTLAVSPAYAPCNPAIEVVNPGPCPPLPPLDPVAVATAAAGTAQGLKKAAIITVRPAPWNDPDYRGVRWPQTTPVVLSTFGTLAVPAAQTVQVQNALGGYLGTTGVAIAFAVAGLPATVLSFRPQDAYRADSFTVACQDQQVFTRMLWTVTVNGDVKAGPFSLVGGKAKLALNAHRGDTVAVNAILATGDVFAVGMVVIVDGWLYPVYNSVDDTYNKVLRASPAWPRRETP
jgi:hypothetical protein